VTLPRDAVFVRGLEFEASHGYTAAERRGTRRFRLSMELASPLGAAASSDRLQDTIDYRALCEIAVRIGTQQTFRLLEALARHIAEGVQTIYPQADVTIELEKLAPPCPGVPEACGVRLHVPARES
jgi:7,8-dihydroneopterin aldolase/epimerase/oxygenase